MECRDVRSLGEAFLSEQLLVETTQAVVAHLARCPACRSEIEGLRRLRAAVRSAANRSAELNASSEFLAALRSRLRAESEASKRRPGLIRRRTWLAIAAGLFSAVGAGAGWRRWSAAHLSALLQAAVGDHRFCALTFRLTEKPITLEEAARRYDIANRALDHVEPSTDRLSGGAIRILERHSCVFDGRRFAHIVLRYKGQVVSLLIAAAEDPGTWLWKHGPAADGTASAFPMAQGFRVVGFRSSRHMAFLVSSLGQTDIDEVARAMTGPVTRALDGPERNRS